MPGAVKCKLLLFADDSALIVSGRDPVEVEEKLSVELSSVQDWLIDNRLSLHLGKTESIVFASKPNLRKRSDVQVRCGVHVLESKQEVTYLGIPLDQSLSGNAITDKIVSKCSHKVKFLYRKARNFDLETKKLLVSAFLQHHFDYACSSWYSSLSRKKPVPATGYTE
ncbi:uncharacterized protein LOC143038827 isoform X1 [Oratosquilla oratoria]|uniref:uncharacterized protein LOC143038827 isoform X1 n=1 Tax=Oratosquilla oratoria TaxID=337810 RepID=UPI003F76C88D